MNTEINVIKKEAGEYEVTKGLDKYLVSKDSFTGDWNICAEGQYLVSRKTKKDCLDFIDKGYSVKILDKISIIPNIEIDTQFIVKTPKNKNRMWVVEDIIYSSKTGKWKIEGSYYNNSIDEGHYTWDYEDFREECEIVSDGCRRKYR